MPNQRPLPAGQPVPSNLGTAEPGGIHRLQKEPSHVASEIERLRRAAIEASAGREKLPQPMFWSLFHGEISALKARKRLDRVLEEILGPPALAQDETESNE